MADKHALKRYEIPEKSSSDGSDVTQEVVEKQGKRWRSYLVDVRNSYTSVQQWFHIVRAGEQLAFSSGSRKERKEIERQGKEKKGKESSTGGRKAKEGRTWRLPPPACPGLVFHENAHINR